MGTNGRVLYSQLADVEQHHIPIADPHSLTACPDCDLLMTKIQPERGEKTICPRCGRILLRHCGNTVDRSLAVALAGLLLFFPAIFLPLLSFQTFGMQESGNILQTISVFMATKYYFVAAVVFVSIVLFPFVKLSFLAIVSLFLYFQKFPKFLGKIFKLCSILEEWAMVEVFLLGIMVTIIKMYHTTEIHFETGFYCFCGLVVLTMASSLVTCHESFWNIIENKGKTSPITLAPDLILDTENKTAAQNNLVLCHRCGKLSRSHDRSDKHGLHCSRCGTILHLRKPQSISKTWAFLIAAAIFLFPANLIPIMRVEFLGIPSSSTILDGIIFFFEGGSYFIAVIIFCASFLIPLFKIVGLSITLLTIHFHRPLFLRQKTVMVRIITFIGKWSMLDIFVVTLLGFFINFSFLTSIDTAPGATYFCLVVVMTMAAAITFDPRMMWDILNKKNAVIVDTQVEKTTLST